MWNADGTGEPIVLQGHQDRVFWASYSPDGTHIVTASGDKTARVWSADGSGTPVVLQGHQDLVTMAMFTADGARIVTTSNDHTIRVWNTDGTGQSVILRDPDLDGECVALSPDGKRIVSASHSERVAGTGETRYVAKVWPYIEPLGDPGDPRLWLATGYCPSIELRRDLLGASMDHAARDLQTCRRRVAEARARQAGSQP